ncbi:Paf1-domain-containing protein [Xylariaceae sp. FL1019]|nr:Paf1-domain-containing protein [Xylariaceae sp. FL1019]
MASSSRNAGEHRSVHQDFIARIRYSNALPPPPHPPKLLDIPNTGLATGQYTAPGFASRLAREQPLNIEADAELGMPLDLVGMPKIFDGDESSIQAPAQQPALSTLHPADRALLRSLTTLGKPKIGDASVSFLRRTEYISSVTTKKQDASAMRAASAAFMNKRPLKRKSPEPDVDSPAYVKRKIDQSFSTAAQQLKDKKRIVHPSKRSLKLVESYPVLPDLESFPDYGGYFTIKFTNNPVSASESYDKRLLNSMIRACPLEEEIETAYNLALKQHEKDPASMARPVNPQCYDYYLAETEETSEKFQQRFDVLNPDHDDEDLYTTAATKDRSAYFQFSYVRRYETKVDQELGIENKYADEVIFGFNDDEAVCQKAAWYSPVMMRTVIRPQRSKTIHRNAGFDEKEDKIPDRLYVTVDDPSEAAKTRIEGLKANPFKHPFEGEGEGEEEDTQGQSQSQTQKATNGHAEDEEEEDREDRRQDSDDDQDAEGDEED